MRSIEALCPPQEDLPNQLKTANGLKESELTARFGSSITAVGTEDRIDRQFFRQPLIKGLTFINSPQVAELAKKPAIQTKTAEDLFGPRTTEVSTNLPDERSVREEVMQSVVILPLKPAEIPVPVVAAEIIPPQRSKEKPRGNILNGFNSSAEIEALQKNAKTSPEQAVRENLANMLRYHDEYTKSDNVVQNPLMQDEDGDLANSDSGLKLLPLISEQERKGAVRDMMLSVQATLKGAKEGKVVIGVSGPGGTEMPDYQSGKEVIYTESQVYVYIKGKGREVRALTFISDMTLEECIRFYQSFAEPNPTVLNENAVQIDRLAELSRLPISVTGGKIDFAGVLKRIEDTMSGRKVMRAANGKHRTFEEGYQLIELGEKIHSLPEKCKQVAQRYQGFLEANLGNINDPAVAEAVRQRMDIAMLEMTRIINFKGDNQPDNLVYLNAFSTLAPNLVDINSIQHMYQKEIAYLLTRPGCNGSGESSGSLTGQSLGDLLSGGVSIGGGSGEIAALAPKCMTCRKELCEGKCFNCEKRLARAA